MPGGTSRAHSTSVFRACIAAEVANQSGMASWEHLVHAPGDQCDTSQPPTSAERSEHDTPPTSAEQRRVGIAFTEGNVRRFTEEGSGIPRDLDPDPVPDHEETSHIPRLRYHICMQHHATLGMQPAVQSSTTAILRPVAAPNPIISGRSSRRRRARFLLNAILNMGERRAPSGEERGVPTHELQIPEQRPYTAVGSSEDDEDFPSTNMPQGARTLATTMVILRQEAGENDGPDQRRS